MTTTHQAIVAAMDADRARYTAPPLEGIKRPISQRQGLTARLRAIETATGGEKAAAAAVGVTARTWRGWKNNPLSRPAARSLAGIERAYQDDLRARSEDPVRQRRYAMAKAKNTNVSIRAEMQWDGYYNGQEEQVAADHPEAPDPENRKAHRRVDFGRLDISSVVRAWLLGNDTRRPMEKVLSANFGNAYIFLNHYYRNPSVTL